MNVAITQAISQLEVQKNIHVLYACESGSRAWGFPSTDSDYDVRIIYAYPTSSYLVIDEVVEDINLPIQSDLDIGGWDLRKMLRLFRKSNVAIFEWLQSPIVYQNRLNFAEQIRALMPEYFSPRVAMHHHLGLAHKAYSEVRDLPEIKLKKYFYILRSTLSAKWVREHQAVPPMELAPLLALLDEKNPLFPIIEQLRQMKAMADENTPIPPIPLMHHFIEQELSVCEAIAVTLPVAHPVTEKLNHLLRNYIDKIPVKNN